MSSAESVVYFATTGSVPEAAPKPAARVPSNGGGVKGVRVDTKFVLDMDLATCLPIEIHPTLPCAMMGFGSARLSGIRA